MSASSVRRVAKKGLRCMLGLHDYVRAHAPDERFQGPNHQVCRRCGKRTDLQIHLLGGGAQY